MKLDQQTILDGLTEPQRDAVTHVDGPMLVLAGPGSGKTTVITRRIAYLISQGIPPWQILALTFTNKAAGEMRARAENMLPDDLPAKRGLTVATFHSFCARLLRKFSDRAHLAPGYSIYDSADQRDAIKAALKHVGLDPKNFSPASAHEAISKAKHALMDADTYAEHADDFYSKSIAKVYRSYERILRENDALDFDDLLMRSAWLLKNDDTTRRELEARFQYVMIDEYQDTNHAQFEIAHALAKTHQNMFVVGDPDQSIYGWRGADIRNILEFETHFPQARVIPLGQNFRSTGFIVSAADALIRQNKFRRDKRLHTDLGEGEKPTLLVCGDERDEARLVVERLKQHNKAGLAWKDMAVLYRINALSRVMEEALRAEQVPYTIARGTAFYDRKEIKDALAYLRVLANPSDEVSLRRIINTPTRGIVAAAIDILEQAAQTRGERLMETMQRAGDIDALSARACKAVQGFAAMIQSWRDDAMGEPVEGMLGLGGAGDTGLGELVERVVRESGLEAMHARSKGEEDLERLENLEELVSAAAQFEPPPEMFGETDEPMTPIRVLQAFLEGVALVADSDQVDPASGTVTLMTLHTAKGLEFDVVAMIGLEEGLLPHSRAAVDERELEEERRLCFVGMTRAKRHLFMSRALVRTHRGLRERAIASQFLNELPGNVVKTIESDTTGTSCFDEDDRSERQWGRSTWSAGSGASNEVFPIGCMVRHPRFGVGRIESIGKQGQATRARISFAGIGVKTLIVEYANLQRV